MDKIRSVKVAFLVVIVMFTLSGILSAQETTPLDDHMAAIEAATISIRGLEALAPVQRNFPSRDEVSEFLTASIDEQLDEETAWRETQFYVAFDFVSPDLDLRTMYLDLLQQQVAGYYDPETKIMNVILVSGGQPSGDSLPLLEQIIYSHEYVHALQDQHFDLQSIGLTPEETDVNGDRLAAIQALVEGDATYVMQVYTIAASQENPMGALLQILLAGAQTGGLTIPEDIPTIFAEELTFPYINGMEFVTYLYEEGGWDLVNQAYTDLPQSTEQILHPQRYLDGDMPIDVAINDVPLSDDWELVLTRPMGEFYLTQYLDTQLIINDARAAATGWGGDRYNIYYNESTGEQAWILKIVWDVEEEAIEFGDFFTAFGDARFEGTARDGVCWSNDTESLCAVVQGDTSLIASAPTQELTMSLLDGQ